LTIITFSFWRTLQVTPENCNAVQEAFVKEQAAQMWLWSKWKVMALLSRLNKNDNK